MSSETYATLLNYATRLGKCATALDILFAAIESESRRGALLTWRDGMAGDNMGRAMAQAKQVLQAENRENQSDVAEVIGSGDNF